MYKCEHCDWTGSASELGHYTEYRGECHGAPAWETLPCCPECGYDVENIEEELKKFDEWLATIYGDNTK